MKDALNKKHQVFLSRNSFHKLPEICDWCDANFGAGDRHYLSVSNTRNWSMSWIFGHATFFFAREKDSTLFALRWYED